MASSSSTSSSRALPFRWLALTLLLTVFGLELAVSLLYHAPAPLLARSRAWATAPHGPDQEIIILGTCLPEATIQPATLQAEMGTGWKVHNLATAAGTSVLWYLFTANTIPQENAVSAVIIPYGPFDLTKDMAPWESEVMEMARWADLPYLIRTSCESVDCGLEILARKTSRAYRYRGFMANFFWQAIGSRAPIPGSILSPGAVDPKDRAVGDPGFQDGRPPPQRGSSPQQGNSPPPDGSPPQGDPSGTEGPRTLGWAQKPAEKATNDPSRYLHLRALLEAARAKQIPIYFTPLPTRTRTEGRAPPEDPAYIGTLRKVIIDGGGEILDPGTWPDLEPRHFIDDVHFDSQGQTIISRDLGRALAERMGSETR